MVDRDKARISPQNSFSQRGWIGASLTNLFTKRGDLDGILL
jgi:hypothetical protein